MSGHRQAAVALHALDERDQGLILAELPAADQSVLRGYLQELRTLGFEATAAELRAAAATAPSTMPERLAQASPAAMFAIFEHEPAALVAQFLAIRDWLWSDAMLAMFPPARRELISAAGAPAAAPARQRFLMAAVNRRLGELARPSVEQPSRSLLAPLSRLVSAWTR